MSDFLNHAITIRDVLYLCLAFVGMIVLLACAAAAYLKLRDRRNAALNKRMREEQDAFEEGNHRNPAYGLRPGIKNQDGSVYHPKENIRNPAYGTPDRPQ